MACAGHKWRNAINFLDSAINFLDSAINFLDSAINCAVKEAYHRASITALIPTCRS
jgi:hypothetical protein